MGTMMIEREKSNTRSIPSIQDFPPCIFYSLYELLFFLSFCSFYKGSCQVKNDFIRYHINTHTHTCTNTKCFLWLLLPLLPRKSPPRYANALLFSFLSVRVGILDGDFEHQSRALSTIPIVSFLSQDGKKDDFCADDEKSILMRALICDVANGNAASHSRA